ncbi:hypothetical protein AGMMS49928_15730 [Spirochaetia bacterium]|nr:hypothetical protein AGMMS49928_15730 [Spirochaetia bacterium]
MGIRGELFSTKVLLPNRTYFFNVKENRLGDLYLNIVESKNKDAGGFDRQSVILFADDLTEFLKGFDESLRVLEKAEREKKKTAGRGYNAGGKSRDREDDRHSADSSSHNADNGRYNAGSGNYNAGSGSRYIPSRDGADETPPAGKRKTYIRKSRTDNDRPAGNRPARSRPGESRPTGGRPTGGRPTTGDFSKPRKGRSVKVVTSKKPGKKDDRDY